MGSTPQWHGHDRERDLPMLGVDPNFDREWTVIDDGRRPDNRDPESEGIRLLAMGSRPSNHVGLFYEESVDRPGEGRNLLAYHRNLALSYIKAKNPDQIAGMLN